MPRESRKINKRRIKRNVALSSIREMLDTSCSSKRYSPFSRDILRHSPSTPKNESLRFTESSMFPLTPQESPELNSSASNATLPVTPPNIALSIQEERVDFEGVQNKETDNVEPEIPQEISTIPSPAGRNAAPASYKEILQSGVQYIMVPINLLQYCLWKNDAGAILPPPDCKKQVPLPYCPPSPPTPPTVAPSISESTPHAPLRTNRRLDTSSDDSDDMVTADESHSPGKWSTPPTNLFPELTNNNSEKHINMNHHEEPMEITLDDCSTKPPPNLQRSQRVVHPQRNLDSLDYSSESDTDSAWSNRVSSVDSEIAGVFARACTSSSSDSEASDIECPRSKVYPLSCTPMPLPSALNTTPMLRRKRFIQQTPRIPSKRRQRPLRKKDSPLIKDVSRPRSLPTTSDSAFSEETVISLQKSDQSKSLSSSVVESMEQDIDYAADNEDSNDGLSPPVPRQLSFENSPIPDHHVPGACMAAPGYPPPGYFAGGHPGFKDREEILHELVQMERIQRWNETFNLDKSMLHLQISNNSGGIGGFPPRYSGFPPAPRCHCGRGYYGMGMPMPQGVQSVQRAWNPQDIYPPAPSPLPHLYYQYPEFMNPPAECFPREANYGGIGGFTNDLTQFNVMGNYRRNYNQEY